MSDQPAFAHITWDDDLDFTPTDTLEASTVATVVSPLRLTSDRDGVVTVYEESFWAPGQNPARYDTEGNKTWEWTRPAPGTAYDATSDSTGVTYIAFDSELFTGESSDPRGRIFKVNPDGTGALLAYVDATDLTSHEFSAPDCTVASVALSSDGSVLYAIVLAGDAEDPAILAGFDTADGALLWDVPLTGGP